MTEKNEQDNKFLPDGSKPNDFIDGIAITTIMGIIIAGIMFYLYNMP